MLEAPSLPHGPSTKQEIHAMPAAAATFSVGEIILIIIAGIDMICCIHDCVKMFYYCI